MNRISIADAALRLREARRILVIGCSGSGKSTLAKKIAVRLSIPFVSMDKEFFWLPGWQLRPHDDVDRLIVETVAEPAWVMDGNSPRTMGIRLPRTEMILWMRPPRRVSLYGVMVRWLRYVGRTRPEMTEDCPEKVDWQFLRYVWEFEKLSVPKIETGLRDFGAGVPVCTLESYADADKLLAIFDREP